MTRWNPFHESRGALTLAALFLLSVLLLGFMQDVSYQFDLFSHFRVHVCVILIFVGLFLIAFDAWWRALVCILVAILGLISVAVPLYSRAAPIRDGTADLRLLSFNILNINENSDEIVAMLEAERPDVVFILEAPALYPHLDRLARTFPYRSGCTTTRLCDLLVLSRVPFLEETRPGPAQFWDRFAIVKIDIEGTPVNLIATHFSKPYADGLQWRESRQVSRAMNKLTGPIVLAGDFNATPWSITVQNFADMNGLRIVEGYRPTWPAGFGVLGFPIDLVMMRGASPTRIEVLDSAYGSNHLGQIIDIDFP